MSDKNQGLNDRLQRKKRVQRMKTGMLWLLITWLLAQMLISVTLIAKVHSLQEQIDIITENTIRSQQVDQQENQASKDGNEHARIQKYDAATAASGGKDKDSQSQGSVQLALKEPDAGSGMGENEKLTAKAQDSDSGQDNPDSGKNSSESGKSTHASGPAQKKAGKVYLTFDDGPSKNTEKILDILDKYQVKATFFLTGREDKESLRLYREIVKRGHTVGMHSYSHQYDAIYESAQTFEEDLDKIQGLIYDATGIKCRLYRFPGGSSNQVSNTDMKELIRILNERNITYFDWNAECGDASPQTYTAEEMTENVMKDAGRYQTSVVLLHDAVNKPDTVIALPDIIENLQKMGLQVLPIDEKTKVVQHVSAESVED